MKKEEVLEHIIVIELYTLLTILAFHNLFILGFDKFLIGDHGDAWQFTWNFWWVRKAISEGRNIFYTDYLFYPHGTSLFFHTLNLTGILLVFPILLIINNLIIIYNLSILLTFVLSAYFMYLFLRYYLKNFSKNNKLLVLTSFMVGLIYSFSPYHVAKSLGYFNLASIQWIPLSLLLFFKMKEKPKFKFAMLLSLSLLLLFFTDFHYFYYIFLLIVFYLLYTTVIHFKKVNKNFILFSFAALAFSISVIGLIFLPAIKEYLADTYMRRQNWQTITFLNYLLPSRFSLSYSISPTFFERLYNLSPIYWWVDSIVSLGPFMIIFLFLLNSFLILKKKGGSLLNTELLFWIFSLLFFFLISLGNTLALSRLLNNFLTYLPFSDLLPAPGRFSILVFVSFLMILSLSLLNFINSIKIRRNSLLIVIFGILFLIFFVDYFPLNFNSYYTINVPSIIYSIKDMKDEFAILNLPHKQNTQGMYLQTIHDHKMLDGFISRIPPFSETTLNEVEVAIKNGDVNSLKSIFRKNNVKYIIINQNYMPPFYDISLASVVEILNLTEVDSKGNIKVYINHNI